MSGFECALSYPTDDPQFALGFEAGAMWAALGLILREQEGALSAGDTVLEQTVHVAQGELVLRMAEAKGLVVEWREVDGTWAQARFRWP